MGTKRRHSRLLTIFLAFFTLVEHSGAFRDARLAFQIGNDRSVEEIVLRCYSSLDCIATFEYQTEGSDDRHIGVSRSKDFGKTWESPNLIGSGQFFGVLPKISCTDTGKPSFCAISWVSKNFDNVFVSRTVDGGLTWSTPSSVGLNVNVQGNMYDVDIACFVPSGQDPLNVDSVNCLATVITTKPEQNLISLLSTDAAKSFAVNANPIAGKAQNIFPEFDRLHCSVTGSICLIAFTSRTNDNGNIQIGSTVSWALSIDGGKSFSTPARLGRSQEHQILKNTVSNINLLSTSPVVSCVSTGDLCSIVVESGYKENGSDKPRWIEAAYSIDGGLTFSDLNILYKPVVSTITADEPAVKCFGLDLCVSVWELDNAPETDRAPMYSISTNGGGNWTKALPFQNHNNLLSDDVDLDCVYGVGCVSGWDGFGDTNAPNAWSEYISDLSITLAPTMLPTAAPTTKSTTLPTFRPTELPTAENATLGGGGTGNSSSDSNSSLIIGISVAAAVVGFVAFVIGSLTVRRIRTTTPEEERSLSRGVMKGILSRWSSSSSSMNSSSLSSLSSPSGKSKDSNQTRRQPRNLENSPPLVQSGRPVLRSPPPPSRSSRLSSIIFMFVPARFSRQDTSGRFGGDLPQV